MANYNNILEVTDLYTSFNIPAGEVRSVNGVSFTLKKGRVLGIVGESGSGKSVTAYSIMQILQNPGRIVSGSIKFKGKELIGLPNSQLQKIRGDKIAIIFQDPMSSLNPVYTIGNQIIEAIKLHPNKEAIAILDTNVKNAKEKLEIAKKDYQVSKNANAKTLYVQANDAYKLAVHKRKSYAHDKALEMLRLVGINEPEKRLKQYPFEFSGGMLQRIMIAMSLVCEPDLLIADEPTTALDVTIQAQILELLKSIQQKMGMAIIIITHDLGVVAQICDEIDVMYAGRIVERGTADEIFYTPHHEYTKGLIKSIPQANDTREKLIPIEGNPVDVFCLPKGCSFAPRCSSCMKICLSKFPVRVAITEHHSTSCFKYVIDAYKNNELTLEQLNRILYYSNEGTASFKPISRLDILDALSDYNIALEKFKEVKKNEHYSQEEKEQFEFKMKEARNNYSRSKRDFRTYESNRRFTRKDRPSTERADMAKKIKDAKKIIRYYKDSDVDKESLFNYLNNLSITSFPVQLNYNQQDVLKFKVEYLAAKKALKENKSSDKLTKTELLSKIDDTRRAYEDSLDKLARAQRVNYRLFRTRRQLISINSHRIKKVIRNNIRQAIKDFKVKRLAYTDTYLERYFNNFLYTNWDLNKTVNRVDVSILHSRLVAKAHEIKDTRKNDDAKTVALKFDALNAIMLQYSFHLYDYKINKYYKRLRPLFRYRIRRINAKNIYNKKVNKLLNKRVK